ncbi:MAG TPA: YHS domain-containing (seleno)protein [Blastocatellia bacterium]|nr:YHS domain-containing (seleno)protein [Blastocatellia bacterium]
MSFSFTTISGEKSARLAVAILIVATLFLFVRPAAAAVDPVNKNLLGTALKGYDAVAYFKEGRPVKGRNEFKHDWMGAKWYFASAANRDEFAKNPEKYAPQFGGYCAWAVGHGQTASIDPEAWKIVDGKLYLNYSKDVQKMWGQDIPGWIKKGNENWPKLIKK